MMETVFCILICENWSQCIKNLSRLATIVSDQGYSIEQIQQGIFNTTINRKPHQFRCYPWTSKEQGLLGMNFWLIDGSYVDGKIKETFIDNGKVLGKVKTNPLVFLAGDLDFK